MTYAIMIDEDNKRLLEQVIAGKRVRSSELAGLRKAIDDAFVFPPDNINVTTDPELAVDPFASLSVIPTPMDDMDDDALNKQRLSMVVALNEARHHFLEPMKTLGKTGQTVEEFLRDAGSRRNARVGSDGEKGMGVGLRISGLIDSVVLHDYFNGKRGDLLTFWIVTDDDKQKATSSGE